MNTKLSSETIIKFLNDSFLNVLIHNLKESLKDKIKIREIPVNIDGRSFEIKIGITKEKGRSVGFYLAGLEELKNTKQKQIINLLEERLQDICYCLTDEILINLIK